MERQGKNLIKTHIPTMAFLRLNRTLSVYTLQPF